MMDVLKLILNFKKKYILFIYDGRIKFFFIFNKKKYSNYVR